MRQLPAYHMGRPRLVARLSRAPIGIIEAGGGYGKTVLAAEFAAALGSASATAILDTPDSAPETLIARLHRALRAAGLSDLAETLADGARDVGRAADRLLDALAGVAEPVLLIVDEAHHASPASAELLARLAVRLPRPHRLLIVGRRLPPGAEALRFAPNAVVADAEDLAFTTAEVGRLLGEGFGAPLPPHQAATLRRVTGGWAAALVMTGPRLARAPDSALLMTELTGQSSVLAYLVRMQMDDLVQDDRAALAQAAHLPVLVPEVADAASGRPGLFDRIVAAGLPLSRSADGSWSLPAPVQEHLTALGRLEPDTAGRAAAAYLQRGEVEAALRVHLAAGSAMAAAEVLAGLRPEVAERLDFVTLKSLVDALPDEAVAAYPHVLLHFARACEPAAQGRLRAQAIERARTIGLERADPVFVREADAEVARDLIRDGEADAAEAIAARILAEAAPGELNTRVRALHVLGRVKAWRGHETSLDEAETLLDEAARLYLDLGQQAWAAQALLSLGYHVLYPQGRHEAAVARLDQLLALPGVGQRQRAVVQTFRAEVLVNRGRYEDAAGSLVEARNLGELLGDHRVLAYAAWEAAKGASQRGERAPTIALLQEAEHHHGDWFVHPTGVEFLADAAVMLDRLGETVLARDYLERARARATEREAAVRIAEAFVEARSGDPAEAERLFERIEALPWIGMRERWRITLFRAYAARRRGDPAAGHLAGQAFDEAAAWGDATLPFVTESGLAERLVEIAVRAGSLAARSVERRRPRIAISLLGGFEALLEGQPLELPPGKPTQLVKLVAVAGGRLAVDEAIEALWPETEPEAGRKGLRNVLTRLRQRAGDVLVREGETIMFGGHTEVDVAVFERDVRRALAARTRAEAAPMARSALVRYEGDLLPDDPYETWAVEPRERLRLQHLRLLDLLAADAQDQGNLDEALRLVERAIDADAFDEQRYLIAASILMTQGRRLRAIAMLERGRTMLAAVGLAPPPAYPELERRIAAAG